MARKNYIHTYIYIYIYIYKEREREREREIDRIITFFLVGEEFKTKIHYPTMKTQERIINPQKGNQKKKKIYERERVIIFWCGKYGLNGR